MPQRPRIHRNAAHPIRSLPDALAGTHRFAIDLSRPKRIDRYIDYFGSDPLHLSEVGRHGHPRTFNGTFHIRPFQLDQSPRLARALAAIRLA